jgi:hypothetical protein
MQAIMTITTAGACIRAEAIRPDSPCAATALVMAPSYFQQNSDCIVAARIHTFNALRPKLSRTIIDLRFIASSNCGGGGRHFFGL